MFAKILIANRGEIACRIIDTCRRLGVRAVAVYSDADRAARHVAMADEAVHLGGPAPAESYLKGDAIIAAALSTGSEAIHPGYGFLSENPDFVDAVTAAGLTFIGPSAAAIRAMGLKDAAKRLMEAAGVPVVPGYHGAQQDPAHLAHEAGRIGYPVLIKAVAGGGGKGMRRVDNAEDFATALAAAQSEAQTAFGNPAVLIEKYVDSPRHIEVQIFGDGSRAVHLFERDCSLQRRHQKVIEEAPAPGMTQEMRAAMGAAAIRAAGAISYAGAGTVEFIADGSDGLHPDRFWFMEMNTRLQVEHPVTEAITGIDLVEWQLRVAAGDPLPMAQEDIPRNGHAFEARLYAEDVPAGFLPATGRLTHLRFPDHCRVETGVRAGDEISPFYDPMVAKIITHGPTRALALNRLQAALEGTQVAGSTTNLAFLRALAGHEGFAAGRVDTGLIARDLDLLAAPPEVPVAVPILAALAVAGLPGTAPQTGFTLWEPLAQTLSFESGNLTIRVRGPDRAEVTLDRQGYDCRFEAGAWWIDGEKATAEVARDGNTFTVFHCGAWDFTLRDPLARDDAAAIGGDIALAPMPGLIKAVFVTAGQKVAKGDSLCIVEAMKMEHVMTAARDGVVAEVIATPGDQVTARAPLIRLEEADG